MPGPERRSLAYHTPGIFPTNNVGLPLCVLLGIDDDQFYPGPDKPSPGSVRITSFVLPHYATSLSQNMPDSPQNV